MSITIQILSDLHLELNNSGHEAVDAYNYNIEPKADVLALLGDIGCAHDRRFFKFLEQQLSKFQCVLFVAGNHEFYHASYAETIERLERFEEYMDATEDEGGRGHFVFLNRKRVDFSSHLTVLGCTLWSRLNEDDRDILSWSLNDFQWIRDLTWETFLSHHHTDLQWLEEQVASIRANEPDREIIVLTHHAPTTRGTSHPKYEGGPTNSAFATELTENTSLWGKPIRVWAFGHTHRACDFVKDGVRVVSNPRGYAFNAEPTAFDPNFTVV